MLGASLYLSQSEEMNMQNLKVLNEVGVKTIFTSLHIPEEDPEQTLSGLKRITGKIKNYGMNLMADVSSSTLEQYSITKEKAIDFFNEFGITSLRIDYGFSYTEIKTFSKHFQIILNASTITEETCTSLMKAGMNLSEVTVCHNYYPRENTGLDRNFFLKRNKYLKDKGFKIQAFIPGNLKKRGPIYAGLPTLEEHRNIDPLVAYMDLKETFLVDEVLIGDILMKESTVTRIKKWIEEEVIVLPITNVHTNLPENFYEIHHNRQDVARDVLRSEDSRVALKGQSYEPIQAKQRPTGSITLDNNLYGRYVGELQVTKRTLPADDRVNVLGQVKDASLGLLEHIAAGVKFQFMEDYDE
ncbi:DUF871 domain-containing protein [Marinilactibacillus psychrotolerans]|uniref:DUF871 domain-containing protein n=1 Tax=Marinilactibacillus psychrotolerans TaxID=191770 RepID=A0ABW8UPE1_9LACT